MCGITGYISRDIQAVRDFIEPATTALKHRGPDDGGVWVDEQFGLALGNRRLAIVDLSPLGHQPMRSASGRFVTAYNGEIYNYRALRSELEGKGQRFRGHSDTEVMLAAFEEWGVQEAIERAVGMFAFAVWDSRQNKFYLIRDRMGEKPLYYGWWQGGFYFASELKALRTQSKFKPSISRDALALYFRYAYVPTPFSIYEDIYKLPQAGLLELTLEQLYDKPKDFTPYASGKIGSPRSYWFAKSVIENNRSKFQHGDEEEAKDIFEHKLKEAIGLQMLADVPVGAFLSGGIDSSTIVALMQLQSRIPVRTFSIGFHESGYDEASFAKEVAAYLGTEHTELYVTPRECMQVIPHLSRLYDEPFADSSQIPTFLVAKLARKEVTVSLSGDGGDELFGGYPRYLWAARIWNSIKFCPAAARSLFAGMLTRFPVKSWDNLFWRLEPVLPGSLSFRNPGHKLHKLASILSLKDSAQLYRELVSLFSKPTDLVLNSEEPPSLMSMPSEWPEDIGFLELMMYMDSQSYLPDDILTKVDRATMGVSLESRAPFLDHRVVEFALSLPLSLKVRNGKTKWLLREILHRHVPQKLVERPKMGFGVPLEYWLRGPLRAWAEDLLSEASLKEGGYLNPGPIRQKWEEHLSGKRDWQHSLWVVLMFQAWLKDASNPQFLVDQSSFEPESDSESPMVQ